MKLTASLLSLLLLPAAAFSENRPGLVFTATMDSIKIYALPGQMVNRSFQLTLEKDQPATQFRASMADWWRSEDGRQSVYAEPGTLSRSCGEWVTLNPTESRALGGEPLTVTISTAIPVTAEPGGYWCALQVNQVPDPIAAAQEGVRVRFLASVAVGVFIYIEPVRRAVRVTGIEFDPQSASITVSNEGNVPLGVEGRLEFLSVDGTSLVSTVPIARHTVLTQPSRNGMLQAPLPGAESLPTGEYLVRAVLDYGAEHYLGVQRRMRIQR